MLDPTQQYAAGQVRVRFFGAPLSATEEHWIEPLALCLLGAGCPEELGAQVLKAGGVWRLGDIVIKRYPSRGWRDRLRPSMARRVARLQGKLQPIHSPEARAVLEVPSGLGASASMLMMDWVDGRIILECWEDEPAARAALGPFIAEMHARKIYHGDFHMGNLMWDGERYVLLDIESVRPAWIVSRPHRLFRRHWARIVMDLGAGSAVVAAYEHWLNALGLGWPPGAWDAIVEQGERDRIALYQRLGRSIPSPALPLDQRLGRPRT